MKKNLTKSAEQVEFFQIAQMLTERGYNQSAIGRLCKLKPAAVSMILSGRRSPSDAVLELMRRAINMPPAVEREDKTIESLMSLREECPEQYKVASVMISALAANARREKRTQTSDILAAKREAEAAEAAHTGAKTSLNSSREQPSTKSHRET